MVSSAAQALGVCVTLFAAAVSGAPLQAREKPVEGPVPGLPPVGPLKPSDGTVAKPDGRYQTIPGYYFETFPHSKVPTEQVFLLIIAFIGSLIFILFAGMCMFTSRHPITSRGRSLISDREVAYANLRTVGVKNEKAVEAPPPEDAAEPEAAAATHTSDATEETSESEEEQQTKDSNLAGPVVPQLAKKSGQEKVKDANEIVGPIVPVLRSDAPLQDSDEDDAENEEDDDDDDEDDDDDVLDTRQVYPAPQQSAAERVPAQQATDAEASPEAPAYTEDAPAYDETPVPAPAIANAMHTSTEAQNDAHSTDAATVPNDIA